MAITTGNSNNNGGGAGLTFLGALTIAFIILKLTKVVSWSWVWVLAPLWMPAAFITVVAIIIVLIGNLK